MKYNANFTTENIDIKKVIIKYSLLLAIFYISFVIWQYEHWIFTLSTDYFGFKPINIGFTLLLIKWFSYFVKIVITVWMFLDYRKYKIKNIWSIIFTPLIIAVGVILFFVNLNYTKMENIKKVNRQQVL